jgi:hypothetical protein
MAQVTRRKFLQQTTLGAATVGAAVAIPGLTQVAEAASVPELHMGAVSGPMVAHIRNISTGEIAIMVGTREIIVHDRRLVARLVKAAR